MSMRSGSSSRRAPITVAAAIAVSAVVLESTALLTAAAAQEPMSFAHPEDDRFPPNTVAVRYAIDPSVLEGVTTSAELVSVLREHLMIEAAMPLAEPLWVNMQAAVQSPEAHGPLYHFLSGGVGFELEGGKAVVSDLASVVRASHEAETFSDWEEQAAWASLREAIETGLTSPLGTPRPRNEEGHVELAIAAVHQLSLEDQEFWDVAESLERDYIELRPEVSFQSASEVGWEPSEGLAYETLGLVIELERGPEAAPPPSVELPAEVLDRYVGRYEYQPGTYVDVRREGEELVMSTSGEGADDQESVITPSSETEFWTKHNGDLVTVTFEVGEDGRVESLTMVQAGFSMTLPRVP